MPISQARWCEREGKEAYKKDAKICWPGGNYKEESWFDALFGNGLDLKKACPTDPPQVMIITGPPGSGKTTLATEICVSYALKKGQNSKEGKSSVYMSLDTPADQVIAKAKGFGWNENVLKKLFEYQHRFTDPEGEMDKVGASVWMCDRQQLGNDSPLETYGTIEDEIVNYTLDNMAEWIHTPNSQQVNKITEIFKTKKVAENAKLTQIEPELLVIDSLNVIEEDMRGTFFNKILSTDSKNLQLIILIMDSSQFGDSRKTWEYISDIIVDIDYTNPTSPSDYFMRTIQIVKARGQEHVWGKHQLKIYAKVKSDNEDSDNKGLIAPAIEGIDEYNLTAERAHPFLEQGGVFIFPSIHYYLSRFKRASLSPAGDRTPVYPESMGDFFALPKGRCAAIIGDRGSHKSRLSYMQGLNNLFSGGYSLIISLRDDEHMIIESLVKILAQELYLREKMVAQLEEENKKDHKFSEIDLKAWAGDLFLDESYTKKLYKVIGYFVQQNRLKILYYPPGNITAEEFFHRMFMAMQCMLHKERLQEGGSSEKNESSLLVLFNSIDQLAARFPLCAREQLFIPGIIQVCTACRASNIFVSGQDGNAPDTSSHYGLLPMADLIVNFKHNTKGEVEIEIERNAGGEPVGQKGRLNLTIADESSKFDKSYGLVFTSI